MPSYHFYRIVAVTKEPKALWDKIRNYHLFWHNSKESSTTMFISGVSGCHIQILHANAHLYILITLIILPAK